MKRNVLTQYLIITASCALYAVGFNWMFDPNHISCLLYTSPSPRDA